MSYLNDSENYLRFNFYLAFSKVGCYEDGIEGKFIGVPESDPVMSTAIRYGKPFGVTPHQCYNEVMNQKQITGKTPTYFGINVRLY